MRKYVLSIVVFTLLSCNNRTNDKADNNNILIDTSSIDTTKKEAIVNTIKIIDSSKYLIPDIYYIPNKIIEKYHQLKKYPFFRCNESNTNLYLVPYTDGSITTAIICKNFDMPVYYKEFLQAEGFNPKDDKPILLNEIISKKGININSDKNDFINLFGKPDSTKMQNGSEIVYWNLQMKETDKEIYDYRKLQPFI